MNLDYNIISLIDALGFLQGIILGLLLIVINKRKNKSTLFLGLFIIAYALELLPNILEDLGVTQIYPILKGLPFNFNWLLFPLFYVYVQEISIFSKKKTSYWILIPGVLFFILNCVLFFQKRFVEVEDQWWYILLNFGGLIFSLFIGFKTLSWIKKHTCELNNQYSATVYKDLHWARLFVLLGIVFTISIVVFNAFETGFYYELFMTTVNIVLLYWISIRGILQQHTPALITNESNIFNKESSIKEDAFKSEQIKETLISKIETYIIKEHAYTQPDLTIVDLANNINEHPKRISSVINSCRNQNFNTYINSFRVEKAINLLKSNTAFNLSIEGIANEVGFHSRSSFYTAFKKVTGVTPSKYKKS